MHWRNCFLLILWFPSTPCCAEELPFLVDMPQNSEQRCVGICGVAEALLEGKPQDTKLTNIDDLAEAVYESFTTDKPLTYPARVMLKGKGVAIDSPAALTALSNSVADLYKADYQRLSSSPAGEQQLREAQADVIKTRKELDAILAADADKMAFFCCFGKRTFPDGTVKDTSHAVLIKAAPAGKCVVYDPNDPGMAIPCELEEAAEGLVASWQCRYRDEGVKTTQSYLLVPQQQYFKVLKAPIPARYSLIRQSRQGRPALLNATEKCDCEK